MVQPLRESTFQPTTLAHAEAVSRLASIRHALQLVEPFGSGPASDLSEDDGIAAAWDQAGAARQRQFERRSGQLVGAAHAGFEALLAERQSGRGPNIEATRALVDQIRRELRDVAKIIVD
jgi:hypothetical protein